MTEIFALIAMLPDVPRPINNLPDCYERELPDGWLMAVNGHGEERPSAVVRRVPAFHAAFRHKDKMWLALVSPFDGTTGGGGPELEDSICDSLRKAGARLPDEAVRP